ncbi:transporter [Elysia marginata]|uniref:Transporter n=1 Tax=Elysia marginata TaxID=1093978 RepID=A0AAV4IXV7_9GAST|nr:transporter [Elysia marginata]
MQLGGVMMLLWQLLITSEMVGLEANIAAEVILMIANIQTLGVPIRYSSVPGTVAAAIGIILIPFLGYVLDRWAKSKRSKAIILAFTTTIQLLGSLLVLLANGLKLALTSVESDDRNGSSGGNLTDFHLFQSVSYDSYNDMSATRMSGWINTVNAVIPPFSPSIRDLNNSNVSQSQFQNQSFSSSIQFRFSVPNKSMEMTHTSSFTTPKYLDYQELSSDGEGSIPFYAFIGMVGYTLLDCGYDSSNCFLKTFVLHCTPVEYHVSVIVKSIMVSSVGGVLVSILGSIDLGQTITAGTNYDSSSALACLVTALANILLVTGVLTTFTCHSNDGDDERTQLVTSTSQSLSFNQNGRVATSRASKHNSNQSYSHSKYLASTSMTIERDEIVDALRLNEQDQPGVRGFVRRQKKQILVNTSAFFLCSSLYSFEVFVVNFLGTRVFRGDPSASVDSDNYHNYLDGVAAGSQGTMIYYITFAISSLLHEKSLAFFGWKKESLFTAFLYGVLCMASAITEELWLFYVVSVWTGMFRAVAVSVPYILANQISAEQNGGKSSGTAIALVAAMLPCGFVVCSAIMGPLIDATGTAAVSMYYSGACAFLGCISIAMLKT